MQSPSLPAASLSTQARAASRASRRLLAELGATWQTTVGSPAGPGCRGRGRAGRQVGVVAHVQVAGLGRVGADHRVHERVGEEDLERLGQRVAGLGQLGQGRGQRPQAVDGGRPWRPGSPGCRPRSGRLSAWSIFTRSSRWRLIDATARGSWSRARSMIAGFCLFSAIASRLRLSMARTIVVLVVSSWPMKMPSWVEHRRGRRSRGRPSALFSSVEMVLSWATPPPLSSRDSAPRTSSTSGLRPVRRGGMVSPSPSAAAGGAGGRGGQRDELLAEQAGLADRRPRRCPAASRSCAAATVTSAG